MTIIQQETKTKRKIIKLKELVITQVDHSRNNFNDLAANRYNPLLYTVAPKTNNHFSISAREQVISRSSTEVMKSFHHKNKVII